MRLTSNSRRLHQVCRLGFIRRTGPRVEASPQEQAHQADTVVQITSKALQAAISSLDADSSGTKQMTLKVYEKAHHLHSSDFTSFIVPSVIATELDKLQSYARQCSEGSVSEPFHYCTINSYDKVWTWYRGVNDQLSGYTRLQKKVKENCRNAEKAGTELELVGLYKNYCSKLADYKRTHKNIKMFLWSEGFLGPLDDYEDEVGLSCSPACDISKPIFCTTVLDEEFDGLRLDGCAQISEKYDQEMERRSEGDQ